MKMFAILSLLLSFTTFAASADFVPGSFGLLGNTSAFKNVHGRYKRDQVTDSSSPSLRIIGEIASGCTGTLISPKHVLTAAHCIYDQENKQWYTDLSFTPGKTEQGKEPYGKVGWKKAYLQQEFINGDTTYAYDFAVIELETSIGETLGYAGFKVVEETDFDNHTKMTGYPGDKPKGTMWTVSCPSEMDSYIIFHECDTFGGMSGSGQFPQIENEDETPMLINGVHVAGGDYYNYGVALSQNNYNLILGWSRTSAYSSNTVTRSKPEYDRIFIQNDCYKEILVAVKWKKLDGTWNEKGFWRMAPGEKAYIADTKNTKYYVWATSSDRKLTWRGDFNTNYAGGVLDMLPREITSTTWGDWTQNFTCN